MKIRYQNGFSISLWNNEFQQIEVTEEEIKYLTQENQWIRIKVPSQWSQNSSSSSPQPPSALANELARESNNTVGVSSSFSPPDMIEEVQRRIDGLQMMWDSKITELAREPCSIHEVNLEELEAKVLDRIEAVRKGVTPSIEARDEEINQIKTNFSVIDKKFDIVNDVFSTIINHDPTLRDKLKHRLYVRPPSDKG